MRVSYFGKVILPNQPGADRNSLSKAIAFAGLTGKETVIDAYCGIGTIGLVAQKMPGRSSELR